MMDITSVKHAELSLESSYSSIFWHVHQHPSWNSLRLTWNPHDWYHNLLQSYYCFAFAASNYTNAYFITTESSAIKQASKQHYLFTCRIRLFVWLEQMQSCFWKIKFYQCWQQNLFKIVMTHVWTRITINKTNTCIKLLCLAILFAFTKTWSIHIQNYWTGFEMRSIDFSSHIHCSSKTKLNSSFWHWVLYVLCVYRLN